MGYAFTFPIVAIVATLAGRTVPIGAYVHYPTISTTMLNRVQSRAAGVTNSSTVASSPVLSRGKLWYASLTYLIADCHSPRSHRYYIGFMHLYSSCLHLASFLMTNSSWTDAHVRSVLAFKPPALLGLVSQLITWPLSIILPSSLPKSKTISTKTSSKSQAPSQNATLSTRIVYPPCDTGALATFPLTGRSPLVLSIAQFRPEKDHATQLRAFALLLKRYEQQQQKGYGNDVEGHPKLVLVGGARNPSDLARVAALQALAASLDITPHVTFAVNAPYPEMLALLKTASVGIHTMIDEHFGISVVELMAAGVVPVAHRSAGPLLDIVVPVEGGRTGYLAESDEEFADGLAAVLGVGVGGSIGKVKEHKEEVRAMRERGRRHAVRAFNEEAFCAGWDASRWRDWL
jgi:alpha-1,2-mannosyltransferase